MTEKAGPRLLPRPWERVPETIHWFNRMGVEMAFSNDESTWDAFLTEWPVERLRTMTLDEYTSAGDKNCFVYWLESRLDQYSSIWGGSAFKFGIYSRNDTVAKNRQGQVHF